jgi:hypothetical protein
MIPAFERAKTVLALDSAATVIGLEADIQTKTKLNSVAFSPYANYTDRATAALSAKIVPTFAGVSRGQRNGSLRPLISGFKTGAATFPFKLLLNYPHEAEWTPLQTHYFSENLVAPRIGPGTSGPVAMNSDHRGG